jgi:hypothetical protein
LREILDTLEESHLWYQDLKELYEAIDIFQIVWYWCVEDEVYGIPPKQ